MPRKPRRRCRRRWRKQNAGWFKNGFDPRRHVFTAQDCRIGWWVANIKHPHLRESLRMRIRCYYQQRSHRERERDESPSECPF
jgi:hypothetical protein